MKNIFFLSTLLFISLGSYGQRVIENPGFEATTASYVKITKIELQANATKIDFEVEYFPNWWIRVSSDKTYIQNSKGGEKYYVQSADGIKLNEEHWTPESGINTYTLYFPAIDKDIEKIDFLEESWKIYEINLAEKKVNSFFPAELQGNWLKTDGSNEWLLGIYSDKVIYQNTVWDELLLNSKGKNYELILKEGSRQEKLYIKVKKGDLLIGDSPDNKKLVSKTKTFKSNYTSEDEAYSLPVLHNDTAIYKGFIKGYHSKMGNTGMVHVNDIILHDQNSFLINIEPDGSFYCEVPMIHPQEVFVRMLNVSESMYLEPGKTIFHYIDLSEYTKAYKSRIERSKREQKSLFMGDHAKVNADLLLMDSINYYDYDKAQAHILDMSGDEFKRYCLNIMEKELEALKLFAQQNQVSKKALQIMEMQIPFRAYEHILSYNRLKGSAYRKKHKVPREQRTIPLENEVFEAGYYDFIKADDLNNPVSLVSGDAYNTLINRIRFSESVRPKSNFLYVALRDSIHASEASLSQNEEDLLNKLIACENVDCLRESIESDTSSWNSIRNNYSEILLKIRKDGFQQMQLKNMNAYFGLNNGFAKEIMYAQSKVERIKGRQKPFEDSDKKELKENISNDFILNYLIEYSDQIEREIEAKREANKSKTGYVVNETPKTEADRLFDAIMDKYKGKVVFVDFWATWCGPCRSGMERIKPLKEELKDRDIEFVYITNQTSPVDTWNMMIPDIKGEHYRVEDDEWNHFSSKFNISGIPHYLLIDKNGTVVKDKIYFASSINELRKMFEEYLSQ